MKQILLIVIIGIASSLYADEVTSAKTMMRTSQRKVTRLSVQKEKMTKQAECWANELLNAQSKVDSLVIKPNSPAYKTACKKVSTLEKKMMTADAKVSSINFQIDSLDTIIDSCQTIIVSSKKEANSNTQTHQEKGVTNNAEKHNDLNFTKDIQAIYSQDADNQHDSQKHSSAIWYWVIGIVGLVILFMILVALRNKQKISNVKFKDNTNVGKKKKNVRKKQNFETKVSRRQISRSTLIPTMDEESSYDSEITTYEQKSIKKISTQQAESSQRPHEEDGQQLYKEVKEKIHQGASSVSVNYGKLKKVHIDDILRIAANKQVRITFYNIESVSEQTLLNYTKILKGKIVIERIFIASFELVKLVEAGASLTIDCSNHSTLIKTIAEKARGKGHVTFINYGMGYVPSIKQLLEVGGDNIDFK